MKIISSLTVALSAAVLVSCGSSSPLFTQTGSSTTTQSTTGSAAGSILGAILGGATGNSGSTTTTQTTTQSTTGSAAGSILGSILGGVTGSSTSSSGSQGILGSLLGTLLGNTVQVTEQSVIGTWAYASPDVRFESENLLSKAGGEVAASQIETKLADVFSKVGIKEGSCAFTFAQNNQAAFTIGGRSISGTYTVDSSNRKLTFKSQTGLITLDATVYQVGNTLTLLYDAKKILALTQSAGALLGSLGSTVGTLSSILNSYEGMQLGMNMNKN
ncbi:MAG: DUF4923 family protein [Bacteroidaceae bacterium]|nr:DUF4923 family protein [Bacteroidaceae bacterium]